MPLDGRLQAIRTAAFKRLKSPHRKRHKRYNVYVYIRDPKLVKELGKDKGPSTLRQEVNILKTLEKNKIRIFKLNRCFKYFAIKKEELLEKTREEVALYRWLKEKITKRRDKRTKRSWEKTILENYLALTKENRRLVKLRGDCKVVKYIFTERTGIEIFNKYRLKIGKGPVIYKCGAPREKEYFLKYKLAKYNI